MASKKYVNYTGDKRASESKDSRFYSEGRTERRPWYCRTCSTEEHSIELPTGWYRLERKIDTRLSGHPWLRLGIYCSIACLESMMVRLRGIEASADRGEFDLAATQQMRNARDARLSPGSTYRKT